MSHAIAEKIANVSSACDAAEKIMLLVQNFYTVREQQYTLLYELDQKIKAAPADAETRVLRDRYKEVSREVSIARARIEDLNSMAFMLILNAFEQNSE